MILRGARLGSMIGAVGGLVFVEVNAGGLPGTTLVRTVGTLTFVAVAVGVLRAPERADGVPAGSTRTYWVSVGAMVVGFFVGNLVLRALGHTDLGLAWVVLAVGLHFVPFSHAFRAPVFLVLAAALVATSLIGGAATLAGSADATGWTGVAAGFVLLAFSAEVRTSRAGPPPADPATAS